MIGFKLVNENRLTAPLAGGRAPLARPNAAYSIQTTFAFISYLISLAVSLWGASAPGMYLRYYRDTRRGTFSGGQNKFK